MIVTLLSDLGTRDGSGASAKAILSSHLPGLSIVDISHHVAHYDIQQAAYLLLSSYKHFPANTLHLVAVDIFSGDKPCLILVEYSGYYFIAPDNGIMQLAFGDEIKSVLKCYSPDKPCSFTEWVKYAGKIAASIAAKDLSAYVPMELKSVNRVLNLQAMPMGIDCNILYVDRYENVVLDLTKAEFDELIQDRPFRIKIMRMEDITTISSKYNDVAKGKALCRFNNADYLEIAINHDKAATLFGLDIQNTASLRYKTVRIFLR